MCEHIINQMKEEDIVKRLEQGYKLSISTLVQAYSISSFEVRIPRFFDVSIGHTVVSKDQLLFPTINTWNEWDLPIDGYHQRFLDEMEDFQASHQASI